MSSIDTSSSTTPRGMHALLSSLIDYAGLFPPAVLDMATVVENYGTYLAGDDAWMLERLIIPVGLLDECVVAAEPFLPRNTDEDPWPLSVLLSAISEGQLEEELEVIEAFNAVHADPAAGLVGIDVVELLAVDPAGIDTALGCIPESIFPFFEISVHEDPRGMVAAIVGGEAGAKIRTGGVRKDLYPSPEQVASFIATCTVADVPFKATAGMHHPFSHYSDAVGTDEFGFLNFFAAGVLSRQETLACDDLVAVLMETDEDAFAFDEQGLQWREHVVDCDAVEDARISSAISFGCCSFDEPRQYLRERGLLS